MSGLRAFLRKEFRETLRTWRIWVLPSLLAFFAVTGPITARYTREIVAMAMGSPAIAAALPEPTYLDAYAQWTKNLGQMAIFAIILSLGGCVSGEVRQGTAVLVLTKPLSRAAFILAKVVAHICLIVVATTGGAALTWAVTRVAFPAAPLGPLMRATATWLLLASLFVALMVLASSLVGSAAGAAGLGLLAFVVLGMAAFWAPARLGPPGLLGLPDRLLSAAGEPVWWPLISSVALIGVVVAAAIGHFRRVEI